MNASGLVYHKFQKKNYGTFKNLRKGRTSQTRTIIFVEKYSIQFKCFSTSSRNFLHKLPNALFWAITVEFFPAREHPLTTDLTERLVRLRDWSDRETGQTEKADLTERLVRQRRLISHNFNERETGHR